MAIRRQFTDEFRSTAIERLKNESVAQVAKDLSLHEGMLYKWRNQLEGKRIKAKVKERKTNGHNLGTGNIIYGNRIIGMGQSTAPRGKLERARTLIKMGLDILAEEF